MKILGIDEAGRGPVIGNLVIAGALFNSKDETKLKEIGVKDSKLILKNKRKILFEEIKHIAKGYHVIEIPPNEIDEAVFSKEMNLNKLEAIKAAMIINKLKPDKAIIDCPSNNARGYEGYLKTFLIDKDVKLVVENKADFKYAIVGAASILAKVVRDEGIEQIKKKYGAIGSGYPADPITKEFIKENFMKHPEIFRKSWATFKNLQNAKNQKNLGEY